MQRIIYILLFSLLYGFCGIINYADELVFESLQPSQIEHIVSESDSSDKDVCRMYDNDMLSTPTPSCIMSNETESISSNTSSNRTSARYRTSTTQRIMATAISNRRAGHITTIFEFNHFRSSLRTVYYLHALCRLCI